MSLSQKSKQAKIHCVDRRRFLISAGSLGLGLFFVDKSFSEDLRSSSPVKTNVLRPPGAVPEEIFLSKCIRCGRCVEVCPYRAIRPLDIRCGVYAGSPLIHVLDIPCYLCMKCVQICPTGTLRPVAMQDVRMGLAVIDKHTCITWREEALCRTCYNVCPFKEKAIHLDELRPVVDDRYCTGCGLCAHGCPITNKLGLKGINIRPIYAFRSER